MIDPIYDIKIDKNDYGYFISIWKNRRIEKDLEVINFLEEDSKKYFKNLMEYNAVFVKLNNLYEGKLE